MNQPHLLISTDGGSRGNPGPAAIGVYAEIEGKCVLEHFQTIGQATNNVAEYKAFITSLEYLPDLISKHAVTLVEWRLDSLLVVEQLNKNWKIKDHNLQALANTVWHKLESISIPHSIVHVRREFNTNADRLVNYALDNAP